MAIKDVHDILGPEISQKNQVIVIGVPATFTYSGTTESTSRNFSDKTALVVDERTGLPVLESFEDRFSPHVYKRFIKGATGALLADIGDFRLGVARNLAEKPFEEAFKWYQDLIIARRKDYLGPTSSNKKTGRPNAPRVIGSTEAIPLELGTIHPYLGGEAIVLDNKNYYPFFVVISEDYQTPVRKEVVADALDNIRETLIANKVNGNSDWGVVVPPLGCEGGGLYYGEDSNSPDTSGIYDLIDEKLGNLGNTIYVFPVSGRDDSATGIGGALDDDDKLGISNKDQYEISKQSAVNKALAALHAQYSFMEKYLPEYADADSRQKKKDAELAALEVRRASHDPEYEQEIANIKAADAKRKNSTYKVTASDGTIIEVTYQEKKIAECNKTIAKYEDSLPEVEALRDEISALEERKIELYDLGQTIAASDDPALAERQLGVSLEGIKAEEGDLIKKISLLREELKQKESESASLSVLAFLAKRELEKLELPDFLTNPDIQTAECVSALKKAHEKAVSEEKTKIMSRDTYEAAKRKIDREYASGPSTLDGYRDSLFQQLRLEKENEKASLNGVSRELELFRRFGNAEAAGITVEQKKLFSLTDREISAISNKVESAVNEAKDYIDKVKKEELIRLRARPVAVTARGSKTYNVLGLANYTEAIDCYEIMNDPDADPADRAKAAERWKSIGKPRRRAAVAMGKPAIENFSQVLDSFSRDLNKFGEIDRAVELYLDIRDADPSARAKKIEARRENLRIELTEAAEAALQAAKEELKEDKTDENLKKLGRAQEAVKPGAIERRVDTNLKELKDMISDGVVTANDAKKANKKSLFAAYNDGLSTLTLKARDVYQYLKTAQPHVNQTFAKYYGTEAIYKDIQRCMESIDAQVQSRDIQEAKAYAEKLIHQLRDLESGFRKASAIDLSGYEIITDSRVPVCLPATSDDIKELVEKALTATEISGLPEWVTELLKKRGYKLSGSVKSLKKKVFSDPNIVRELAILVLEDDLKTYIENNKLGGISEDGRTQFYAFAIDYRKELDRAKADIDAAIRKIKSGVAIKLRRLVKSDAAYTKEDIEKSAESYADTEDGQAYLLDYISNTNEEDSRIFSAKAYGTLLVAEKIGAIRLVASVEKTEAELALEKKTEDASKAIEAIINTYYSTQETKKVTRINDLATKIADLEHKKSKEIQKILGTNVSGQAISEDKIRELEAEKSRLEITIKIYEKDTSREGALAVLERRRRIKEIDILLGASVSSYGGTLDDLNIKTRNAFEELSAIETEFSGKNLKSKDSAPVESKLTIESAAQDVYDTNLILRALEYADALIDYRQSAEISQTILKSAGGKISSSAYANYTSSLESFLALAADRKGAELQLASALENALAAKANLHNIEELVGEIFKETTESRAYVITEDKKLGIDKAKFKRNAILYATLSDLDELAKEYAKSLGVVAIDLRALSGYKEERDVAVKSAKASVDKIKAYINRLRLVLARDPDAPFAAFKSATGAYGKIDITYYDYDPNNQKDTGERALALKGIIDDATQLLSDREAELARIKRRKVRRRKGGVKVATEEQRDLYIRDMISAAERAAHSELQEFNSDILKSYLNYLVFTAPVSSSEPIRKLVKVARGADTRVKYVMSAEARNDVERAKEIAVLISKTLADITEARGGSRIEQMDKIKSSYLTFLQSPASMDTEEDLRVISFVGPRSAPDVIISEEMLDDAVERKNRVAAIIKETSDFFDGSSGQTSKSGVVNWMTAYKYLNYLSSPDALDTSKPLLLRDPETGAITRATIKDPAKRTLRVSELSRSLAGAEAASDAGGAIDRVAKNIKRAIGEYSDTVVKAVDTELGRRELLNYLEKTETRLAEIAAGKLRGSISGQPGFNSAIREALDEALGYKQLRDKAAPTISAAAKRDELVSDLDSSIAALISGLAKEQLPTLRKILAEEASTRQSNPKARYAETDPLTAVVERLTRRPALKSFSEFKDSFKKSAEYRVYLESIERAKKELAKFDEDFAGLTERFTAAMSDLGLSEIGPEAVFGGSAPREISEALEKRYPGAAYAENRGSDFRNIFTLAENLRALRFKGSEKLKTFLKGIGSSPEKYIKEKYNAYKFENENSFVFTEDSAEAIRNVVIKYEALKAFFERSYGAPGEVAAAAVAADETRLAGDKARRAIGAKLEEVADKKGKVRSKFVKKYADLRIAVIGATEVGAHITEIKENNDEIDSINDLIKASGPTAELTSRLRELQRTNAELEVDANVFGKVAGEIAALLEEAINLYGEKKITVIVGMTEGFAQLVADIAIENDLKLVAQVPYDKEASTTNTYKERVWGKESMEPRDNTAAYDKIIEYAEKTGGVEYTATERPKDYEILNGKAMVDRANVIWVYPGDVKGLSAIEQYAKAERKDVYEIMSPQSKLTRSGGDKRKDAIARRRTGDTTIRWKDYYNKLKRDSRGVVKEDYYEQLIKNLSRQFDKLAGKIVARDRAMEIIIDQTKIDYTKPDKSDPSKRVYDYTAIEKQAGFIPQGQATLNVQIAELQKKFAESGGDIYKDLLAAQAELDNAAYLYNQAYGTDYTAQTIRSMPADQMPAEIADLIDNVKKHEDDLAKLSELRANNAAKKAGMNAPYSVAANMPAAAQPAPAAYAPRNAPRNAPVVQDNSAEYVKNYLRYLTSKALTDFVAPKVFAPLKVLRINRDPSGELSLYLSPTTGKPAVVAADIQDFASRRAEVLRMRKEAEKLLADIEWRAANADPLKRAAELAPRQRLARGVGDQEGPVGAFERGKQAEELAIRAIDNANKIGGEVRAASILTLGANRVAELVEIKQKLALDQLFPGVFRKKNPESPLRRGHHAESSDRHVDRRGHVPGRRANPESNPISVFAIELGIDFDPSDYSVDNGAYYAEQLLRLTKAVDPEIDIVDDLHAIADSASEDSVSLQNKVLYNRIAREAARLIRSVSRGSHPDDIRNVSSQVAKTLRVCAAHR